MFTHSAKEVEETDVFRATLHAIAGFHLALDRRHFGMQPEINKEPIRQVDERYREAMIKIAALVPPGSKTAFACPSAALKALQLLLLATQEAGFGVAAHSDRHLRDALDLLSRLAVDPGHISPWTDALNSARSLPGRVGYAVRWDDPNDPQGT